MKSLHVLFFVSCAALCNPTPGPLSSSRPIMQTLEFVYHYEQAVGDSSNSIILYGGPTAVYIWHPEDVTGFGFGLEAGVEARKYLFEPRSRLFLGGYGGYGVLWREHEDEIAAVSLGLKLGWRENLHQYSIPIDLEPYFCLGYMVHNQITEGNFELRPVIYLGLKAAIF